MITVEQKGTKADGTKPEPENHDPDQNLKNRISTITEKGPYDNNFRRFIYDETTGRLAKIEETQWENDVTRTATIIFTYGEGTVSYEHKDQSEFTQRRSSIVLDENGRGVSVNITAAEKIQGVVDEWTETHTLHYDAEGYLVKNVEKGDENDYLYLLTWTDGNPTQVKWGYTHNWTDSATYGTVPNTANLDLNRLCVLSNGHFRSAIAFNFSLRWAIRANGRKIWPKQ